MRRFHFTLIFAVALLGAGIWAFGFRDGDASAPETGVAAAPAAAEAERLEPVEIAPGSAYGTLMIAAGVEPSLVSRIFDAAAPVFDLSNIRAGRTLDLRKDLVTGEITGLTYRIDSEEELHVRRSGAAWIAGRAPIPYETRVRTVEGTIESSLYAAATAQGLDDKAVIALAEVFQWTIDFALDVRAGDAFKFVYEERWRDGMYVMPGRILAAKYVNDGAEHRAFWFEGAEGEGGHYDERGESLRRIFLKAPVAFKYITSGYTTGLRYVSAFNTSTGHRAIDYAASTGTPVRAVGDGTVVTAGWNGPFGNFVSIRHNETYTTNYAHLSRIHVKRGARVSQGQTIGAVGSTGFSTGPHLHYEMVKRGTKINPLREEFPASEPVAEADKARFEETVRSWDGKL